MPKKYVDETDGQLAFYTQFAAYLPELPDVLIAHTDGVVHGNLLEFKTAIDDTPATLQQAVKYLSKLRMSGRNVPRNVLLVDIDAEIVRVFDALDYRDSIHRTYASAASKDNSGFQIRKDPEIISNYLGTGAHRVIQLLRQKDYIRIDISQECVVPWAERYYREVPGSTKENLLGEHGELLQPKQFKHVITPYTVPAGQKSDWKEFERILDRLNDKLKKIELGAFYTPEPYVLKSYELLEKAIARVPPENDYVVIDRCAGTGNLQRNLGDIPCPGCIGDLDAEPHTVLAHCIVNTKEKFEYLELLREFGQSVRSVIPPTVSAGEDSGFGTLLNGDAMSDRFVLGAPIKDENGNEVVESNGQIARVPNEIQQYLDDDRCTIILFENPPYGEVAGMEAQKMRAKGAVNSFSWKEAWVRKQMSAAFDKSDNGTKAVNDLASIFIWSAVRYYLRKPEDSYVVYSPCKYLKSQSLINLKFLDGFLFNRKRFHATKDAGVSVILWANESESKRETYPLAVYDIDQDGELFPGAIKSGFASNTGNIRDSSIGAPIIDVMTTRRLLSDLYDTRTFADDEPGIVCEMNGTEAFRATRGNPIRNDNAIGYLVAQKASFENTDLSTLLTRAAQYNGNGFHLRSDNFLSKLPLFVVGRTASEGRFWIRGVVNRTADNGDNFSHDDEFLKRCLIYTGLAFHNKCRSFTGSDGVDYRNELCFDGGTIATKELERLTKVSASTEIELQLFEYWNSVLTEASKVTKGIRFGEHKAVFDPSIPWGLFQIDKDLNTKHSVLDAKGRTKQISDYPELNGAIKALKIQSASYHRDFIEPKLWKYGLLK